MRPIRIADFLGSHWRWLVRSLVVAFVAFLIGRASVRPGMRWVGDDFSTERAGLNRILDRLDFKGIALEDALEIINHQASVSIVANRGALEAAGINLRTPVTARAMNLRVGEALGLLLGGVGGPATPVGYRARDGIIYVTTRAELDRLQIVRLYDVDDLMRSRSRSIFLESVASGPQPRVGSYLAVPVSVENYKYWASVGAQDELVALIERVVAPGSWSKSGGRGSIRFFGDRLTVIAIPEYHEQIARLLQQLRIGQTPGEPTSRPGMP